MPENNPPSATPPAGVLQDCTFSERIVFNAVYNAKKFARSIRKRLHIEKAGHLGDDSFTHTRESASELIAAKLASHDPVMIARFGQCELSAMTIYHNAKSSPDRWTKLRKYVNAPLEEKFWWSERNFFRLAFNAGFFPLQKRMVERYCELMIEDMLQLDVLASWLKGERVFENKLAGVPRIRLVDLFPFIHRTPWSHALEGRRVLVVHPFADSIQKQYARRALLFKDPRVLPEFELTTLKAVQSIAGNKTGHSDWFAALDEMKEQMTNIPHDIALIGCGAYGFPLAAHAKRLGKKAVHMGGATQLLFGIRGKRWDQDYAGITDVINTHWTRPAPHEVPTRSKQIEGGCYW